MAAPITPQVAMAEPITPQVAMAEPITPEATMADPLTPEAAMDEPFTPEAATAEPFTPEAATAGPLTPEADDNTPNKPSKPKNRKRKSTDDEPPVAIPPHILKRLLLSLTKPSYLLGVGSTRPRAEHRARLNKLLRKLVKQHNWVEAGGVLSVLLQGGRKDKSPVNNRFKYSVLMGMLERLGGQYSKAYRIRDVFEVWEMRNGTLIHQSVEYRFAVQLERILLCLTQGNLKDAHPDVLRLKQLKEFGNEPLLMMMVGLTFRQLWYSTIPKEMRWRESDQFYTAGQSNEPLAYSEGHYAGDSHEAGTAFQCGSYTSVMNDKVPSFDADSGLHREISEAVDDMEIENSQPNFGTQNFYANSAENTENEASLSNDGGQMQYTPIFAALEGLESLLLPIRLPDSTDEDFTHLHKEFFNDYYKDAVKYLQLALHSTPPILVALHPLIQLLLIGGQVKEALNELEYWCSSNAALPIRLRARLLEQFDRYNSALLSTCFEDTLKNDPTCCDSLAKLLHLHQNEEYSSESLLEMIALHLDATYADYNTWREFALCFLKLFQYEEDRMSVCLNGDEGGHKERYSVSFNKTPKIFTGGKSGKSWRLRCRWWCTRHFSHNTMVSEIAAGDLQLLTYKTACAAHMYGPEFHYVVDAYAYLEKEAESDLLMFLRTHIQNSVRVCSDFQHRTG